MLQEHRSRPLWARELKPQVSVEISTPKKSRPLWARELKPKITVSPHKGPRSRAPCGRVN